VGIARLLGGRNAEKYAARLLGAAAPLGTHHMHSVGKRKWGEDVDDAGGTPKKRKPEPQEDWQHTQLVRYVALCMAMDCT